MEIAEDSFSCKICFECYDVTERRPKILSACGHTFCFHCVSQLFGANTIPACPVCRKEVGQNLIHLKDNYELMELLPSMTSKKGKSRSVNRFWCSDCKSVASGLCIEQHSLKSLAAVAAEKGSKTKENLDKKVNKEKVMLQEVMAMLQSTLKATDNSIVARLQTELDICRKRLEELDNVSKDMDIAQETVVKTGDVSLFSVFDEMDNSSNCLFLHERIESMADAMKCKLTVTLADKNKVLCLGQSQEDKVLEYLLSILLLQPVKTSKGSLNDNSTAESYWALSPWITKWNQLQNINDGVGSDIFSDSESVASDIIERNRSRCEVYVCAIKREFASYQALKDIFSKHATVVSINVVKSRKNHKNPWCAFIKFDSEESVKHILNQKAVFERDFELQVKPRFINVRSHPMNHPSRVSEQQRNETLEHKKSKTADVQQSDERSQRMLFIQNVPCDFPEYRISEALSKYGPVQDVRKQSKPVSGMKPRAFAFVTFVHKYSAQKALAEPIKRIHCPSGVSLEYRAYHNRPNGNLHVQNKNEDSTSKSNISHISQTSEFTAFSASVSIHPTTTATSALTSRTGTLYSSSAFPAVSRVVTSNRATSPLQTSVPLTNPSSSSSRPTNVTSSPSTPIYPNIHSLSSSSNSSSTASSNPFGSSSSNNVSSQPNQSARKMISVNPLYQSSPSSSQRASASSNSHAHFTSIPLYSNVPSPIASRNPYGSSSSNNVSSQPRPSAPPLISVNPQSQSSPASSQRASASSNSQAEFRSNIRNQVNQNAALPKNKDCSLQ